MYEDIIDLPHHVSERHPRMSMMDRAAQFSPFAALTGYDVAIKETARLTDKKIELTDEMQAQLNDRLNLLQDELCNSPTVEITYFIPDNYKEGGSYHTLQGQIKRIDSVERIVCLCDGTSIHFDDILDISGELFRMRECNYLEGRTSH